jgi:predicted  nucleic acid-binding Zn-ribbon protein
MTTIAALRQQRTNLLANIKDKEQTVKNMDATMRGIRGDIAKLKAQEKTLTSQITKMAKEEL